MKFRLTAGPFLEVNGPSTVPGQDCGKLPTCRTLSGLRIVEHFLDLRRGRSLILDIMNHLKQSRDPISPLPRHS
jgi:hypothetical protein